jgi:hypothetical protein
VLALQTEEAEVVAVVTKVTTVEQAVLGLSSFATQAQHNAELVEL